jgi:hypothetical protein
MVMAEGVPASTVQNYIALTTGQVAQLVEQRTENPRVGSSILPLAIWRNAKLDNRAGKPNIGSSARFVFYKSSTQR